MSGSVDLGWYVPDGRRVTYDEPSGAFAVGGAQVTHDMMRAYQAAGRIGWGSLETQIWFEAHFGQSAPAVPAVKAQSNAPAFIVIALLVAGAVIYFGWSSLESERINADIQQQKIDLKRSSAPTPNPYKNPFKAPTKKNPFSLP